MKNLQEGLIDEIRRNRELLEDYKSIGPAGTFAFNNIKADIEKAENALKTGEAIIMLEAYYKLEHNV